MESTPTAGFQIVGAVDDSVPAGTFIADGVPILGRLEHLEAIALPYGVRELLVAPTALSREELLDLYRTFGR